MYDLDLTSCLFRTGRFVGTTFEGATSFMLTEFSARLDLTGARFNGQANFTMADINGSMECTRVTFATGAAFDNVRVRTVVFDGTVFMADADLRFADMTAAASFAGTKFRGNFTLAARRPRTFVNLAGISVRGTLDISALHRPTLTTVEGARVTQPELTHRCTPDLTIDDRNGCLLLTTDRQPAVVLGRQRHDDGERTGDPRRGECVRDLEDVENLVQATHSLSLTTAIMRAISSYATSQPAPPRLGMLSLLPPLEEPAEHSPQPVWPGA
ncbi:pentapeptide repeat-containing protein [Actinoplanes teichomyceticus]|uniref:pentapeptide repeat-containing protein n=1 Tax=Actinoplanes teichomyceticus TaxID=1867 RepID=UPI0011A0945E|nr:pentapeptide repeat-containing protein [Actinoplanes teichomyceticus]GIF12482.1 hypothetical protein Ate01nite_25140 [Actinoplanes teichomyceticus]